MKNSGSKNILIFNGSGDLYGANRILSNTVYSLIDKYNITLYLPVSGPLTDYIRFNNPAIKITIFRFFPLIHRQMRSLGGILELVFNTFRFIIHILSNYKFFRSFDLIFINTLSCTPLILIFKLFGFRVVVHVHEILSNEDTFTHIINCLALRFSDSIIGVSKQVSTNLQKAYGSGKYGIKVSTIWNGIEDMLIKQEHPANTNLIFTLFGRIKREKGQWLLLDAIALLPTNCALNAIFRFIGSPLSMDDPGYHNWLDKVDKLRISSGIGIEVINFVPDISTYLNETDIVLVPSIMQDPFPTVILEGLSAGKIVVASDRGGSTESIDDGLTGILFNPADAQSLQVILTDLIINFGDYSDMQSRARASYLEKFTIDEYKKNIRFYFEALLS